MDFDAVAADSKRASLEILAALVLNIHQPPQQRLAGGPLPRLKHHQHPVIRFGRPKTVNARNRGHDDDVAPLEKRSSRTHAQPVKLVVDGGLLFNVGVRRRQVRFGLVIVVIADEIFHRVLREEIAEFVEELRRERLVVREHQRRPVHVGDDLGHRERLARAGYAQKHLVLITTFHAAYQMVNGLRLIAAGFVITCKFEVHGGAIPARIPRTTATGDYNAFIQYAPCSSRRTAFARK